MGPLSGLLCVRCCRLLSNLPFAVHLVTETPILDVVRLVAARVFASQIRVVPEARNGLVSIHSLTGRGDLYSRVACTVAVLDPVKSLSKCACAHVEDDERFNLCDAAPLDEPARSIVDSEVWIATRHGRTYSFVPNWLLSSEPQAGSGRRLRWSSGPTPSSQ